MYYTSQNIHSVANLVNRPSGARPQYTDIAYYVFKGHFLERANKPFNSTLPFSSEPISPRCNLWLKNWKRKSPKKNSLKQ